MKSFELISKILATENISVVRSNVFTASFNIEKRILTLPTWKNLTDSMEMMLIGHEVSHALHTTEYYIRVIKESKLKNFSSYLNIVEDARIERLIKKLYPGIRKDFYTGYQDVYEKDIFEIGDTPISSYSFIDRINIFYKLGQHILVEFSDEEKVFVDRVGETVTESDVYNLALDIYNFEKKRKEEEEKQKPNKEEKELEEGQDNSEEDTLDAESESGEKPEDGQDENDNNSQSETDYTPDDSVTQKASDKFFEKNTDSKEVHNLYFDLIAPLNVVSEKSVLKSIEVIKRKFNEFGVNTKKSVYKNVRQNNIKTVQHLVTEFEMRKAANQQKRTLVAKSGKLDMNRLAEYKIVDDMFKRFKIQPDSENHGLIVLVDWSGSMSHRWAATINQLMILVLFLKKVGIKFEIHAFTSNPRMIFDPESKLLDSCESITEYERICSSHEVKIFSEYTELVKTAKSGQIVNYHGNKLTSPTSIVTLVDHKMTMSQIESVLEFLFNGIFSIRVKTSYAGDRVVTSCFGLGVTPTNEAMVYELSYVEKFKAKNNIQKMNMVLLTDGMPTYTSYKGGNSFWRALSGRVKYNFHHKSLKLPITRSEFYTDTNLEFFDVLCEIFKKVTSSTLTVYYIGALKRKINVAAFSNLKVKGDFSEIHSNVSKNGWAFMNHSYIDKLIFIDNLIESNIDNLYDFNPTGSTSAISRALTKTAANSFNSKAFARTLIDTLK